MAKRRFKCPKCQRSFSMAAHLSRHLNAIHGSKKHRKKISKQENAGAMPRRRRAPKRARSTKEVVLTTGYVVDLAHVDGLEHLFNAMVGESTIRLKRTREFKRYRWGLVYDACVLELHYAAGQLLHAGSGIDLPFLLDEFRVQWDRIAEKLNKDD